MNWGRVPIVKFGKFIANGLKGMAKGIFITFPLKMAGYEWCSICDKRISPKEELKTHFISSFAWKLGIHYCNECYERMGHK